MNRRISKFVSKLDSETRGKTYDRLKPEMVKHQSASILELVLVEKQVKALLTDVHTLQLPDYIIFGKELLRLSKKHKSLAEQEEFYILCNKWCERGLNPIYLNKIANLLIGMACKVIIWDGVDEAKVTPEGFLDVKTHSSDNCFTEDYAVAQTAAVIITPAAGKRLKIVSVYTSVGQDGTNVTLYFTTSGNIVFKLYTIKKAAQTGNVICGVGAVNETLSLTCPPDCFISIAYDEVD